MKQAKKNRTINVQRTKGHDFTQYPLPDNRFSIIYADPPWDYGGKMQYSRPPQNERTAEATSAAQWVYPTMKFDELKKIPVREIIENDSLLFLWSTSPHLPFAIELGKSWGFHYSTVAFVWDKQIHNPGRYTLSQCELCLVMKHGKIPTPRGARNVRQLVSSRRGSHSEKPIEIKKRISDMFPHHSKIELFARNKGLFSDNGWISWGNQI